MKKPVIIGVSALVLLASASFLFAQTTTGSSLITEMKVAVRSFTLAGDLNPGVSGIQSAPVSGKKTGDMLTAGEWNRVLELVAQGGGGGGGGASNPLIICEKNFSVSAANNNGYTFVPADCGGTLPDNTYIGVLSKYGIPGGEFHPNVINAGETVGGYAGPGFFVWSVSATAGTGYVRIVYIKKSGLVGGTGGGSGWVNVPLTDTAPFDPSCDYRVKSRFIPIYDNLNGVEPQYVAIRVSPTRLVFNQADGVVDHLNNDSKDKYHQNGWHNSAVTVLEVSKRCGGTGGGGGGTGGSAWVKYPIAGSTQFANSITFNDGRDYSPVKVCQDAGYTSHTGACRILVSGRTTYGALTANQYYGTNHWSISCTYGDRAWYFSATSDTNEILCIK